MQVSVKGFIYHKTKESFVDCFDRYGVNTLTNKFAMSDGVSKSFFPAVWAELLVEFFLKNDGRINIGDVKSYEVIQNEWVNRVAEIVNKPNQKYFVRNFFNQGRPAAATFVGLNFFKQNDAFRWEAIALGDSFLFFIPEEVKNIDNDFDKVFHLSSKENFEFNNFPDFFDSRSASIKGKIKQKKGYLKSGTFYMMTDALSEWFISEKQKAVETISEWKSQDDFVRSVTDLRKINLQNDDVAILIIQITEDSLTEIVYKDILVTDFHSLLEEEKKLKDREIFIEALPASKIDDEHITNDIVKSNTPIENQEVEENKFNNSTYVTSDLKDDSQLISVPVEIVSNQNNSERDIKIDNNENDSRKHSSWEEKVNELRSYWYGAKDYMAGRLDEFSEIFIFYNGRIDEGGDDENYRRDKQFKKQQKNKNRRPDNDNNQKLRNQKNSAERTKPDEDATSITDKF